MALDFNEAEHRYTVDGRDVPSVTQVISRVFPELYAHSGDFAKQRGSIAHKAIALDLEGVLDEDSVSPVIAPYLAAARRFLAESHIKVMAFERRLYSPTYGYAGTLDVIGLDGKSPALWDWKTGAPGWQAGLQTAAYVQMWQEAAGDVIRARFAVHLHDDGSFTVTSYPNFKSDFADFCAALRVYHRKEAA